MCATIMLLSCRIHKKSVTLFKCDSSAIALIHTTLLVSCWCFCHLFLVLSILSSPFANILFPSSLPIGGHQYSYHFPVNKRKPGFWCFYCFFLLLLHYGMSGRGDTPVHGASVCVSFLIFSLINSVTLYFIFQKLFLPLSLQ